MYNQVEVNVHQDGTIRVYGNGGLIFECHGKTIKTTSTIFPVKSISSGEVNRNTKDCKCGIST